jgi:asparagine synthase (glutamine-hydrolysing)
MVGICGTLGGSDLPEPMAEYIGWRDDETTVSYSDDSFDLRGSFHSLLAGDQPIAAEDGDVLIWVWGDVYGYGSRANYVPRKGPADGSAAFCAHLYEVFGMDFVAALNGNFALVIYDQTENSVSFVTDRFATRPLYYARPNDDAFLVSSHSQSLSLHPDIEPAFEPSYLYEYLELRRVFGTKTPIAEVEEFPPASVITIDLDDMTMETTCYWTPTHEPIDRPFSHFVDRFVDTIQQVFSEWTHDDLSYGLLLSGGSDSRLGLAAIDQPVTAFHNADWVSREAKIARRAADETDNTFKLLERSPEYDANLLERAPSLSNFSGWFDQAYFLGFEEEITQDVDVLVSGLYADMLFGGGPLVNRMLSLGSVGNVTLPATDPIESVSDYVSAQTSDAIEPLPYFTDDWSLSDTLTDNIHQNGDGIISHGVQYESLQDLVMYGDYYPMGADTDAIFSRSLAQMRPYRTPFLDNRIVDLQRQIPARYFLRRNIVNTAIERIEPSLAEIPHPHTGIPLKYPFIVDYLGKNFNGFWWKHIADDAVPEPHLDHTPWPNREELIRARSFASETLDDCSDLLNDLPFLDTDGAWQCYHEHLNGTNNTTILYSLLTLLRMPITEQVHQTSIAPSDSISEDNSTSTIDPTSARQGRETR